MKAQPWRLEIEHRTAFSYEPAARASYNEVRMVPLTTIRQTTMTARVETAPSARQFRYWDYWGTQVVAFDVPAQHRELEVRAISVVDAGPGPDRAGAAWSVLARETDVMAEFLTPTPYTAWTGGLVAVADQLRKASPAETVEAVVEWVHASLRYEQGVTGVHTSAAEALKAGKGVCQDFAHLAVALLRRLGIPARYVSGYLYPKLDPAVGEAMTGESHAWIEVWTGDWWEADPTNLSMVGPRHVTVGRGRDYADVAPVKGIYAGGGDDTMTTRVRITRTPRD